jgi:hypothetical protein
MVRVGVAGGTATSTPIAAGVVYALALRVRQAVDGCARAIRLAAVEALFVMRESVEWADDSLGAARAVQSSWISVHEVTT